MIILGTAWTTTFGTKRGMPSYPHNHSGLEPRSHTNPTSLSSVHGGTQSIFQVFCGISRVGLPEGVGGAALRTQKSRSGRMRFAEGVPRQGNVVLRQCGNSAQDAVLDVHDTVI
jgi:hypothetical protein